MKVFLLYIYRTISLTEVTHLRKEIHHFLIYTPSQILLMWIVSPQMYSTSSEVSSYPNTCIVCPLTMIKKYSTQPEAIHSTFLQHYIANMYSISICIGSSKMKNQVHSEDGFPSFPNTWCRRTA